MKVADQRICANQLVRLKEGRYDFFMKGENPLGFGDRLSTSQTGYVHGVNFRLSNWIIWPLFEVPQASNGPRLANSSGPLLLIILVKFHLLVTRSHILVVNPSKGSDGTRRPIDHTEVCFMLCPTELTESSVSTSRRGVRISQGCLHGPSNRHSRTHFFPLGLDWSFPLRTF